MSQAANDVTTVSGSVASADAPGEGMHFATFGAALASAFALALLLPFTPLAVLLLAAWGVTAGLRRIARPGWRSLPFTRARLAFSPMDGLLWAASMGIVAMIAALAMAGRLATAGMAG